MLGVWLALSVVASYATPQRSVRAGIVKIPLTIHNHNPKVELSNDGRLIVSAAAHRNGASEVALFRFLSDGSLDSAFGTAGRVVSRADGSYASVTSLVPQALTIQPDGRIVVAGEAAARQMYTGDFLLMRFLADGRPDTSLDGRGWTVTNLGTSIDLAHDAAVLADKKIVAVGGSTQSHLFGLGTRYDFAIVRYLSDGRLDQQFGEKGTRILRLGFASEDIAYAVKQDAAGRILVAGRANTHEAARAIALLRFQENGQLDKTFGKNGTVIASFGNAAAHSLSIQPNRMIVVAGDGRFQQPGGWAPGGVALRYGESGEPDNAFGTAGVVQLPWVSELRTVRTQRDGKIVLLGTRRTADQKRGAMVVTRLNPDGILDPSFGDRGVASVEFPSYLAASGMALSDSNEVFVCGMTGYRLQDPAKNPDNALILFKLNHRGEIDDTFGR